MIDKDKLEVIFHLVNAYDISKEEKITALKNIIKTAKYGIFSKENLDEIDNIYYLQSQYSSNIENYPIVKCMNFEDTELITLMVEKGLDLEMKSKYFNNKLFYQPFDNKLPKQKFIDDYLSNIRQIKKDESSYLLSLLNKNVHKINKNENDFIETLSAISKHIPFYSGDYAKILNKQNSECISEHFLFNNHDSSNIKIDKIISNSLEEGDLSVILSILKNENTRHMVIESPSFSLVNIFIKPLSNSKKKSYFNKTSINKFFNDEIEQNIITILDNGYLDKVDFSKNCEINGSNVGHIGFVIFNKIDSFETTIKNKKIIGKILNKLPDIDYPNPEGESLLLHAVRKYSNIKIAEALIEYGADLHFKDKNGNNIFNSHNQTHKSMIINLEKELILSATENFHNQNDQKKNKRI